MSIVLFAILGAALKMGTAYWICFSVFCFFKFISFINVIIKAYQKQRDK